MREGIYIHIPYCQRRCKYCDFLSFTNFDNVEKYITYLIREIEIFPPHEISSIFIGGGTPSSIDGVYIEKIMAALKKYIKDEIEITIEANPNSLTEKKVLSYKRAGINRISMGAQSSNDTILKTIGRLHKREDVFKAVKLIKKYGFTNFNLDFMLDLPGQTLEDIKNTLEDIKILNPEHISYYSLILEDGTPLKKEYLEGKIKIPPVKKDRQMYRYLVKNLEKIGYKQYETSNFAKNFPSSHNLSYWKLKDYIGYGLNAHSNLGLKRFYNTGNFEEYFSLIDQNKKPTLEVENLTKKDRINEYFIMGLRLTEGIDLLEASKKFEMDLFSYYKEAIENNIKYKTLIKKENKIFLTTYGKDVANQVELDFMK